MSEFDQHWNYWKTYKWGMTDDLLAIVAANGSYSQTRFCYQEWV